MFECWNVLLSLCFFISLLLQRCHSCGKKPRGHGSSSEEDAGGPRCQGSPLQRETERGEILLNRRMIDRSVSIDLGPDNKLKIEFLARKRRRRKKRNWNVCSMGQATEELQNSQKWVWIFVTGLLMFALFWIPIYDYECISKNGVT